MNHAALFLVCPAPRLSSRFYLTFRQLHRIVKGFVLDILLIGGARKVLSLSL
jgi:hypothetical protein